MNWLRSTTFCASVPSHTDAMMNSASAAMAPNPGDRTAADSLAADWANSQSVSTMIRLRRLVEEVFLGLFFAQLVVRDHEIRQDKAQDRANGPRHDDAPEYPVGKSEHIRQRRYVAAISQPVADGDRVDARRQPDGEYQQRFAARTGQHRVFQASLHRKELR